MWASVVVLALIASACGESANERAHEAALRVRAQAGTRESESVPRASTPADAHRILYHAPTDLSETSARATNAAIYGLQQLPPSAKSSADAGAPRVAPPR
jgi:triphosphoribosyl-dephospho-CoA synthetase